MTRNGTIISDSLRHRIGFVLGPLLALILLLFFDLKPGQPEVTRAAAISILMAVWWITEAIPIPATALLPVALFPLFGIMNGREVAAAYFNNVIFLFIGGFIMALAMERWNLHRRIALHTILLIGASPKRVILGFMLATAFLSMWISNTATTMMMVPIAMAVILKLHENDPEHKSDYFSTGLLIGIAYAASIGGIATLIGTPPNLAFVKIFETTYPAAPSISFAQWIAFGTPFAVFFLMLTWLLVTFVFVKRKTAQRVNRQIFRDELKQLGRMSFEEKAVLVLFLIMCVAWLTRREIAFGSFSIPGWSSLLPEASFIDDGTVAIAVSLLLFLIPSRTVTGQRLMNWKTAVKLRWGIVILFGGGFALAAGFKSSGLSHWVTDQLAVLAGVSPVVMVGSVSATLTFLTELTSNTATTQIVLPLLGSLAEAVKMNPLLLMIPATLSASCAFMLPVATPPNAIIFGTGEVRMVDMVRIGIFLNLIGVIAITTFVLLFGDMLLGIDLYSYPIWAG